MTHKPTWFVPFLLALAFVFVALWPAPTIDAKQPATDNSGVFRVSRVSVFALRVDFEYEADPQKVYTANDAKTQTFSRFGNGFVFEEAEKIYIVGPAHAAVWNSPFHASYKTNIHAAFYNGNVVELEAITHDPHEDVIFFTSKDSLTVLRPLRLAPNTDTNIEPGMPLMTVATHGAQWYAMYGPLSAANIVGRDGWPPLLMHSQPLIAGASGSPLIDPESGLVVGMNGRALDKLSFATPAATIRRLLPR